MPNPSNRPPADDDHPTPSPHFTTYDEKLRAQTQQRGCPVWVVRHIEDSGFCKLDARHRGTHQ